MDPSAQHAAIIRRLYEEVFNRHQITLLDTMLAPQIKLTAQSWVTQVLPRDGFKQSLLKQREQTPDHQYRILDLVAHGDTVYVRLAAYYQHRLPIGQFQPTGRMLEAREMCFYRFHGGLITEVCTLQDEMALMMQCSPAPTPIGRW